MGQPEVTFSPNLAWPVFGWSTDMRPFFQAARAQGRALALATLVRTQGSAPRPPGAQMLFNGEDAAGYLSGGCVEADVAHHAQAVLTGGGPRQLIYGQGSPWQDITLPCGSSIEILLERLSPDDQSVGELLDLAQRRQPARWISDGIAHRTEVADNADPAMTWDGGRFARVYEPAYRVIIVGGDPVPLAIAALAINVGFETILVRPSGPREPPPIANLSYRRDRPEAVLDDLAPDAWTAVIAASHQDETDDATVLTGLRSNASYVGVVGSRERSASRRERLAQAGLSATRMGALYSPIGVAQCGKAPWEIAVSVIAQIMQTRTRLSR